MYRIFASIYFIVKANFLDGKRKIQLDVNGHDIITGAAKIECLSSERERERETILALEIVIYGSVSSSVRISHNVLNQKEPKRHGMVITVVACFVLDFFSSLFLFCLC
eukprot:764000_1